MTKLQWFFRSPACNLLLFYDSLHVIPELAARGILENSHAYFMSSWCVNLGVFDQIHTAVAEAEQYLPRAKIISALTFLMNSAEELHQIESALPDVDARLFSEPSLLDEQLFEVRDDSAATHFNAVYNARAMKFKRHWLTSRTPGKLFVTYDLHESEVDLWSFGPDAVVAHLPEEDVPHHLRQARVGLMLSAQEGACYASLEYLLCGLPAVSTESWGGRAEYYDESNSVICAPTPDAVAASVKEAQAKLDSGFFSPRVIREGAIARMAVFRRSLARHMAGVLGSRGVEADTEALLKQRIPGNNKLRTFRNSL